MFSAYHRLWNPEFSDQKNEETYQECFRGHGHNYVLEVTVKGKPNGDTGMVMDIKRLHKLLMREIHVLVDHKSLNDNVEFLKGVIPTAENVSLRIWKILKDKLNDEMLGSSPINETFGNKPNDADLHCVKLIESERNVVEYFGE